MRDDVLTRANNPPCARCGFQPDPKRAVNYCPRCGEDLRSTPQPPREPDTEATGTTTMWTGQVIADRYRLIRLLGEGGMGAVFKAEHIRMGKALAVKLLRGTFARDPAAVARFKAEAQIVSRLSHPHTIAVFDFGEVGNQGFYLAMEYVPGKDLSQLLGDHGPLPEARAIGIAEQVLGSLAEAHDMGVVHRDVKPGNVMVVEGREGDFVKLLDFGIAKLRDVPGAVPAKGAILGTPSYLAPEQARGVEADGRADLYAVGAVLYELVSGHPPFQGTPNAVRAAHIHQAPPPLHDGAKVSRAFAEAVHRALQKEPGDRFPSADAMRDALLAIRSRLPDGGRTTTSVPVGKKPRRDPNSIELANRDDFAALERGRWSLRRPPRLAAPIAAAALVVLGALVWRWGDVYGAVARHAPALTAILPAPRAAPPAEGDEQEPNDTPATANALALPAPGAQPGALPRGPGVVRGHVGASRDGRGDVDVFRLDVPDTGGKLLLVAEWGSERAQDRGIAGLGVALTLNRAPKDPAADRLAALVAHVDRGAGQPERLVALVTPGAYYLAVREQHAAGKRAVERPDEAYVLRAWLEEPRPGEEIEPNDEPLEAERGEAGYGAWRELAQRNPLGEGSRITGETSADDRDTYSVGPRGVQERPELVLLVPASPQLALTVQLWMPDADDLAPDAHQTRFVEVGEGEPGQVMAVRLPAIPSPSAPALVRLRAAVGDGKYEIMAVGSGAATGTALRARMDALAAAGRLGTALELAATFGTYLSRAPSHDDVLLAAGALAARMAPELRPDGLGEFERVGRAMRRAPFEVVNDRVRYTGAFELMADGHSAVAEAARLRAVTSALPCTPDEVAARARSFLERYPRSHSASVAQLALGRAEEDTFFDSGAPAARDRAVAAYRAVAAAGGKGADEARDRIRDLTRKNPSPPAVRRTRCE